MKGLIGVSIFMLLLAVAFFITGCKGNAGEPTVTEPVVYEKIHKMLTEMQTYKSEASVKYITNKNVNTYETMQFVKMSGEYRIEVLGPEQSAGNITVFDGTFISQFNTQNGGRIFILAKEDMARSEILISSFVKNYLDSMATAASAESVDDGKYTVIEAEIPGEHPYLSIGRLWINNKKLVPTKLIIYDPDGGERIVVNYENFEYNIELANDIFDAEHNY
jgi:outer membrane lipoprotein-sorting protein